MSQAPSRFPRHHAGAPAQHDSPVGLRLKQCLQLRFHFDSTIVRLQFDRATTIRRPTLRPCGAIGIRLVLLLLLCPAPYRRGIKQ